jgi:hypothetical protein
MAGRVAGGSGDGECFRLEFFNAEAWRSGDKLQASSAIIQRNVA